MAKHVRTTITVPPDLKARMDAVEEEVNWSAVAAQAFEQRLAQIIQRQGARDMNDVIDRLRASTKRVADRQYQKGLKDGAEWTGSTADVDELDRLDNLYSRCHPTAYFDFPPADMWSGQAVAAEILGVEKVSDMAIIRLKTKEIFGSERPHAQYVKGFVKGAVELWRYVRERLWEEEDAETEEEKDAETEEEETEEDAPPEPSPSVPSNRRGRHRRSESADGKPAAK
jgi:hypothetical protein